MTRQTLIPPQAFDATIPKSSSDVAKSQTHKLFLAFWQQRGRSQQHGGMSMKVTGPALAPVIVGQDILLPRALAYTREVVVLVDIANHCNPGIPR